jgi:hypothetical protein
VGLFWALGWRLWLLLGGMVGWQTVGDQSVDQSGWLRFVKLLSKQGRDGLLSFSMLAVAFRTQSLDLVWEKNHWVTFTYGGIPSSDTAICMWYLWGYIKHPEKHCVTIVSLGTEPQLMWSDGCSLTRYALSLITISFRISLTSSSYVVRPL